MSTILKRLQKVDVAMQDPQVRTALGLALKEAAIDAMMHGIGTTHWASYMSLFADNTDQLTRLTVESDNDEGWLRESRAYMVANAICGADSTTRTSLRVDDDIDNDLDPNPTNIVDPGPNPPPGAIVRPFKIP